VGNEEGIDLDALDHERCHFWSSNGEETLCGTIEWYHHCEYTIDEYDDEMCECGRKICKNCLSVSAKKYV